MLHLEGGPLGEAFVPSNVSYDKSYQRHEHRHPSVTDLTASDELWVGEGGHSLPMPFSEALSP